jgi:hypothetical protein
MSENHDPPSNGNNGPPSNDSDSDAAFWRHIGEQTRHASLESSQSEVQRARATAAFANGAPSPWPRRFATMAVVALSLAFLAWAIWQVSVTP